MEDCRRVPQRARILGLILATGLTLGGCSFAPQPSPNPGLTLLWSQAQADARRADAPNIAELRATQAAQIRQEALRACGHSEDGSYPATCDLEALQDAQTSASPSPADAGPEAPEGPADLERSAAMMLEQLVSVDADSVPLIVRQYTELVNAAQLARPATASPVLEASEPFAAAADADRAAAAARWEYAAAYALGVAGAYLLAQSWQPQREEHLHRARALEEAVSQAHRHHTPDSAAPALGAAGYEFTDYPTPHDAASAQEMIAALDADTAAMWLATAATAEGGPLRRMAAIAASFGPLPDNAAQSPG